MEYLIYEYKSMIYDTHGQASEKKILKLVCNIARENRAFKRYRKNVTAISPALQFVGFTTYFLAVIPKKLVFSEFYPSIPTDRQIPKLYIEARKGEGR